MANETDTMERDSKTGVRGTAEKAIENARDTATQAFENFESSPIALVLGGIAVGAVIGALLPRLAREKELLGPLGRRIAESAGAAVEAVRETGKAEIEALIPDKDATKDKVTQLVGNVLNAAKDAAANPKS